MRHELDPRRSVVTIRATSSIHPIEVEARDVRGYVDIGRADGRPVLQASGRLELPVADLRSGNPLIDRETRRRLDLRSHPRIVAVLEGCDDDGHGTVHVSGQITVHGVTRPASGALSLDDRDHGIGIRGESSFDVREWHLSPPSLLLLRVDPIITIAIDLLARTSGGTE